jgi:hypothetical protein
MLPNTGGNLKRQVRPSRTKSASRQGNLKHRPKGTFAVAKSRQRPAPRKNHTRFLGA